MAAGLIEALFIIADPDLFQVRLAIIRKGQIIDCLVLAIRADDLLEIRARSSTDLAIGPILSMLQLRAITP